MIESFEWYKLIPGVSELQPHVAHAILVALILFTMALIASRKLAAASTDIIPSPRFSLANLFEIIYDGLFGIMKDVLGDKAADMMPIVGSLALFILFSNLLGLIPGLAPPTDSLNTTVACAITVFFATHYFGFKTHGLAYLKQFMGPYWWLAWLMIPIEIISHLARPLSLSLRLFGNLMGDHLVTTIFILMSVNLTKAILHGPWPAWVFVLVSPLVPLAVFSLGLFVAFVQTFVFTLLTLTYLSGAVSEHH